MTHEDLKNYISYWREEEERTTHKLDVLKRRQERKLKKAHEKETLIENEAKEKREKDEKEKRERDKKEKREKEEKEKSKREEREGERKEKEKREKRKKEESRKREKEEKREKEKEIRGLYELPMKKGTNFPLVFYCLWTNYSSKSNDINNGKKKGYFRTTCSSCNKAINNVKTK